MISPFIVLVASEHFEKGKRQNVLRPKDIEKIVSTYQFRTEEERFSCRVEMKEIEKKNEFNLNISGYVSTAKPDPRIDLTEVNTTLLDIDARAQKSRELHNQFLKELGQKPI